MKITQRQSRASHAVALLHHGRSRSRKGKEEKKENKVERHTRVSSIL